MQTLKVGFVGCGLHATRDLFPSLSKVNNIRLIATCDLDVKKAKKNASKFGEIAIILIIRK